MTLFQAARRLFLAPLTSLCCFFKALSLPAALSDLPYGAPTRLRIPTYDGSGQATHPDILGPDGKGRPFLLSLTPYPYSIDRYENPSILASSDGLRFREERRGLNPLAPAPSMDHNDDPDLSFADGEYRILYLETLRPDRQNLVLLRSRDRLSWTRSIAGSNRLSGPDPDPFILSPALAERGGESYLYYVDKSVAPYRIEYKKGRDLGDWGSAAARLPAIQGLDFTPWHIDIVSGGAVYYMLITAVLDGGKGGRTYDLRIARSLDLESWTLRPEPVFLKRPFGCRDVYRSTAYVDGGDMYIYFSFTTKLEEWRIGVVRESLGELFGGASGTGR